ncbi:MAG: class B sortase [Oscillospiraceae bacterium]|nr:class B sortase [Oscillospiraceae bacterium]
MKFGVGLKISLLILSIIVFLVSGTILFKMFVFDPYISEKNIRVARDIYEKKDQEEFKNVKEKLEPLIKINSDIKGWIKIENTPINYPVVQSKPDEPVFYLDKNYLKKRDSSGSIFINAFAPFGPDIQNIVLHGHSMRNGSMFAALLKYDLDFYKKTPVISFDSIYAAGKWKIFAILRVNTLAKDGKVFNYLNPKFNTGKDFLELVYQMRIRSSIDTKIDIAETDKILTLSTCCYDIGIENSRAVIVARKIRYGESKNVNTESASKVKNPLMPEAWYKMKGIKMPEFSSFEQAYKENKINWIKT